MAGFEASRERRAKARVGSVVLGKWRLDRLLGFGGMAAVYAATHRAGSRVAVKVLHAELALDDEACVRFAREGYAANMIDHPGTVRVLDDDKTEDGAAFLVMELLDGETLEERRTKAGGTLDPREVVSIADEILDVLVAAHERGVIHRDIKPENVFLDKEGRVRVLDFGLARMRETSASEKVTASYGQILGTPAFLPPEQAGGRWEDIDETTDIWALGATMFMLLTGRYVHEAETLQEMITAAITRTAPTILSIRPTLSPGLAAVVDKALARDKTHRYRSATAMRVALRDAAAALEDATISMGSRPTLLRFRDGVAKRRQRPRRALAIAVGAIAFGTAVAATAIWSRPVRAPIVAETGFFSRVGALASGPVITPEPVASRSPAPQESALRPDPLVTAGRPAESARPPPPRQVRTEVSATPPPPASTTTPPPPMPTDDPMDRRH